MKTNLASGFNPLNDLLLLLYPPTDIGTLPTLFGFRKAILFASRMFWYVPDCLSFCPKVALPREAGAVTSGFISGLREDRPKFGVGYDFRNGMETVIWCRFLGSLMRYKFKI